MTTLPLTFSTLPADLIEAADAVSAAELAAGQRREAARAAVAVARRMSGRAYAAALAVLGRADRVCAALEAAGRAMHAAEIAHRGDEN